MAKSNTDQPQLTADQLLEARVDAMMDPHPKPQLTTAKPAASGNLKPATVPELDIFADAPPLSPPAKAVVVAEPIIDDAKSDAAIDDIIAHEADTVLAAEDAGLANAADGSPELINVAAATPRRHPFFWSVIILLVIVAIVAAYVLANPNY